MKKKGEGGENMKLGAKKRASWLLTGALIVSGFAGTACYRQAKAQGTYQYWAGAAGMLKQGVGSQNDREVEEKASQGVTVSTEGLDAYLTDSVLISADVSEMTNPYITLVMSGTGDGSSQSYSLRTKSWWKWYLENGKEQGTGDVTLTYELYSVSGARDEMKQGSMQLVLGAPYRTLKAVILTDEQEPSQSQIDEVVSKVESPKPAVTSPVRPTQSPGYETDAPVVPSARPTTPATARPSTQPGTSGRPTSSARPTFSAAPSASAKPSPSGKPSAAPVETTDPEGSRQVISAKNMRKAYGSRFKLKAKTSGDGRLSYKSLNKKIATVSKTGKVKIKGYGSVKIKITASATARYKKASKKITIRVVPKTPGLTRAVSPSANTVSIAWTRDRSVTGYQIYFSKTADFSKDTVQKMLGNGQSSVKLQGPPSGVKYYVKIRAYKKVGKKTIYSGWSAVKTVTIR